MKCTNLYPGYKTKQQQKDMRTQITNMRNERRRHYYLSHGLLKGNKGILGTIVCPKI